MIRDDIVREENDREQLPLLDWPGLQETCLYKENLIDKLLTLYLQQLPTWIGDIQTAVAKQDAESLRRICHTVKGATAALHASASVQSLDRLHCLAREGDLTHVAPPMNEVITVLEKTGGVIRRILDS